MDVVTLAAAKKYTKAQITALAGGFNFLGKKSTAADLPTSGNNPGDTWYVIDSQQFWFWIPDEWVTQEDTTADAMIFKGTVGNGGTVTTLPTNPSNVSTGDTYAVCADGTYAGQGAVVGDLFVANKDTSTTLATITWDYIPSGNSSSGVMERDFTTKINVGLMSAGTDIHADDSINDILYNILYKPDTTTIPIYYGAVDAIPTSFTGLTSGTASLAALTSGTYTIHITAGNTTTHTPQYVVFAVPHKDATENYVVTAWFTSDFHYNIDYSSKWLLNDSNEGYNIYYLDTPSYDTTIGGIDYVIKVKIE